MPVPRNGVILYDKLGKRIDVEELVDKVKNDKDKVLIDDANTLILDLTGLDIYTDSLNFETGQKREKASDKTLQNKDLPEDLKNYNAGWWGSRVCEGHNSVCARKKRHY